MKLKIEITPNSYEVDEEDGNFPFCWGKIYIGDNFWESITPALNDWSIEDYERQWKEGLERIKTHDTSCLVSSIQNPHTSNPFLDWWVLYKVGNKIFIRNQLIVAENYENLIGDNVFSPESCYKFIRPRVFRSQEEIDAEENPAFKCDYAEWVVNLNEK